MVATAFMLDRDGILRSRAASNKGKYWEPRVRLLGRDIMAAASGTMYSPDHLHDSGDNKGRHAGRCPGYRHSHLVTWHAMREPSVTRRETRRIGAGSPHSLVCITSPTL